MGACVWHTEGPLREQTTLQKYQMRSDMGEWPRVWWESGISTGWDTQSALEVDHGPSASGKYLRQETVFAYVHQLKEGSESKKIHSVDRSLSTAGFMGYLDILHLQSNQLPTPKSSHLSV